MLQSYFAVVRKKIADSVPKAVDLMLIDSVKRGVQPELVSKLYGSDAQTNALFELSQEMIDKRQAVKESIKMMRNARG